MLGTGAAWAVGNCAIAMPAATGLGGNGLHVAEIENVEIAATGVDPMAAQYVGAHSTHTCGLYLAQWPQWSEFRNIDIRGLNTGVAIPPLPVATPAGLTADSNRWQNITINATHAFTAGAGSNDVLDNVVAMAGNSAATAEPPTGLVLDLGSGQQGWTVRNAVVLPSWNAVQPQLTVTAAGGAVTAVAVGSQNGLGFDPYGTQVPLAFSGSCTAQATAAVNSNGSIASVSVTQGGVGCSGTTTASVNVAGTWDTAAPVNLIGGQSMTFFAGNLLKGTGGYTVWNATNSESNGTQVDGGGGNLPGGGTYAALVANSALGTALQVDEFPGADIGAKIQACLGALSATYGGTCDARDFTGSLSMGSNLTISTGNAAVLLPCATIATASRVMVTAGTRNVSLRGCALLGGSAASGSQGGTAFLYSGTGALIQVGDPTYAVDTPGFHMDNVVINTTAATSATAQGLAAYRAQDMNLENLYFLGNQNQTGMTLDGTGNYAGGSFFSNHFSGFATAVNAIGHQIANAATTDWMNASTFVRLHIDCPTSGGSPMAGTYGINLQQGDGNTFTGGDVEGCNTALHLGANAQNNTIVGLRNENSNNQVVADAGSAYNNWMTGGTMFTGQLTDNGTRNSFLDTFHRSFNGLNGDWYGSQKDATVTNHLRLGIGAGNERGLLNEIQTDYGYRWIEGYSDATAGEQFYQIDDVLNNVNRLSIGQYNNGQSSTNDQTVVNAAGTGAVVLNGSTNAGTGGVVIGSGGASESTVATISNAGNAQFNGTLLVGGTSQSTGTMTVRNNADAEVDYYLWPGLTTSQKGSFTYKDWNGNSQWYMVKDASNNWALNSAVGGLDSFKAYQSTNSGDTYVNAANPTGVVRVNYESGSGTGFNIYGGNSSALYASFTGTTSIKFPGLAAASGHYCVQVDTSGFLTNTGSACGTGSGGSGSGTVGSASSGQIAYYTATGTTVGGENQVPLAAGGTGASTAAGALTNLGAQAAIPGLSSDGANGMVVTGNLTAADAVLYGTVEAAKIGAVFQCDQFSGANISAKLNACNTAALENGGGTIDARNLLNQPANVVCLNNPALCGNAEVDLGGGGNAGIKVLLPATGVYQFTQVGGPATNASLFSVSTAGSGYVTGDLIYPTETGFAYSGAATGAVFSVTASGGAVTALTLVSGGRGYLTSKYVTTTTSGSGAGLVISLNAADCGIRLNGSVVLEGESVPAGAANFWVTPDMNATTYEGFVAQADVCVDGGYDTASHVKTQNDGPYEYNISTGTITDGAWLTAATTIVQGSLDQTSLYEWETSGGHDNDLWFDGDCCSTNAYSPHADEGDGQLAGIPIIVGGGATIRNACITNGSNVITFPYGHATAKWLGDTLPDGVGFPNGTIVTGINSLTSITVSANATGTTNTSAMMCQMPALTEPVPNPAIYGTGLTIALTGGDGNQWALNLYNPVANAAGPGLPNIEVESSDGLNIFGAYEESNGSIDPYTGINYLNANSSMTRFYANFASGLSAKPVVDNESASSFMYDGNPGLSDFIVDQGVAYRPTYSGVGDLTYIKGGLPATTNVANLLPDTGLKRGSSYWTVPAGASISSDAGTNGDNAFTLPLTGTSSGSGYIYETQAITLQGGTTYTMAVNAGWNGATSGNIQLLFCQAVTTSSCTALDSGPLPSYGDASPALFPFTFMPASTQTGYFAIHYNGWLTTAIGSGTYTSGLTVSGQAGQQVCLSGLSNGSTATALVSLTGTNTIAGSTALNIATEGSGATSAGTITATASVTGCGISWPANSVSGTAAISVAYATPTLTISEPLLVAGQTPTYVQNEGGSPAVAGASDKFAAIAINGASSGTYVKADGTGYGTPTSGGGIITCADSSGSGTAQSCTPSSTVSAGMCMAYTAGTSNSGTSLTLNATGSAIPVAKWQASTATLQGGDVKAGVPVLACLNTAGTYWTVMSIGNAPSVGSIGCSILSGCIEQMQVTSTSGAISGIGLTEGAATSSSVSTSAATSGTPYRAVSTSAATSGDAAGWYQTGLSYYASWLPTQTLAFSFPSSSDYAATQRAWLGLYSYGSGSCSYTTMEGSDTPYATCSVAAIRFSTAAGDTKYMCYTGNGSTSQVQSIGVAPGTSITTASISFPTASSVTCTVNGVSVTNTTGIPTGALGDIFINTSETATTAFHLSLSGVAGQTANGSY